MSYYCALCEVERQIKEYEWRRDYGSPPFHGWTKSSVPYMVNGTAVCENHILKAMGIELPPLEVKDGYRTHGLNENNVGEATAATIVYESASS